MVDLSRHMRQILELNVEQRWVRVQAGVIKDQLNAFLKPYGFFFAPDLSTSNRATIGGMVNTDASGQGSLVYGKTSDHALALKTVLIDGNVLNTRKMPLFEAEHRAEQHHAFLAEVEYAGFLAHQLAEGDQQQRRTGAHHGVENIA